MFETNMHYKYMGAGRKCDRTTMLQTMNQVKMKEYTYTNKDRPASKGIPLSSHFLQHNFIY